MLHEYFDGTVNLRSLACRGVKWLISGMSDSDKFVILAGIIGAIGAVIGAIAGGWIAGWYSRKATSELLAGERAKDFKERQDAKKALLLSLKAEIQSVWSNYMETSGYLAEKHPGSGGFSHYIPVIADYFPVYHGNVTHLGLIEDAELQNEIISVYNIGKSLIDAFTLNNEFLRERDRTNEEHLKNDSTHTLKAHKARVLAVEQYGPKIKVAHDRAKIAVESLLGNIDDYLTVNF
jgi:hypothetical protein